MAQAVLPSTMSPQEYLAFERAAEVRHEYAEGHVFAMAGGTIEHATVAANLLGELRTALFDSGCRVLTSDMRIGIPNSRRYVYPDGAVVCESPAFEDDQRDILLNPKLILEVLSDSSEAYDRGDKFASYQTLPSLQLYLLASQRTARIEVFEKQAEQGWLLRSYGPGERVQLMPLSCTLAVDRIYAGVFEET